MEHKKYDEKRFRRYKDAASYFGICQSTLEKIAKGLKATHKVGKIVLVDCKKVEAYIESCPPA
ncbi:MAG: hypothetical protein K6B69_14875 [Lachnospiraceae bacterium]|nr:hypothetical protein [Lachnospiraceae bacterium]